MFHTPQQVGGARAIKEEREMPSDSQIWPYAV
jgi:hypothetical protein